MVNSMPQKRFRYTLVHPLGEIVLSDDPKGWDGHEIGFERSEDFGLNIQNIVPLSFFGAAGDKIKELYGSNGIFAKTSCKIEKRNNTWTYDLYYTYKHDYSTFKDNLRYIEISGLEEGLAKKFDTYKDTEYEIDLPATNKTFISYTGANYTTQNILQCSYGSIKSYKKTNVSSGGYYWYPLKASRSVRAYTNKIAFTDASGLPYETMTFRALATETVPIKFTPKIQIKQDSNAIIGIPAQGKLQFYEHDTNFENGGNAIKEYIPTSGGVSGNNRIDIFDIEEDTINVSLEAGKLYTMFYRTEDKIFIDINVQDGALCFMDISQEVNSAYQNQQLECFTYEWLIGQLLSKIDSNALPLQCTVAYPHVKELLTATPCIRNMGKTNGTGKLKTTLSDVLESFNKLKCIAIDIEGQQMTISDRFAAKTGAYRDVSYGIIEANNIVVEHDSKYQYNKIKVGADTDDREDDDPLVYPFICEKEFSVEDTIADNELDLVNNFMLDPYQIDKYIMETLGNADNKDECEFAVMACVDNLSQLESEILYWNYEGRLDVQRSSSNTLLYFYGHDPAFPDPPESPQDPYIDLSYDGYALGFLFDIPAFQYEFFDKNSFYRVILEIDVTLDNRNPPITANFGIDNVIDYATTIIEDTTIRQDYSYYRRVEMIMQTEQNEDVSNTKLIFEFDMDNQDYMDITTFRFEALRMNGAGYLELYRNHTKPITGFSGDSETIYNIPLTPKRILKQWEKFLALSVVGSPSKKLKFGTTKILNSGISAKCDWESAEIPENTDLDLSEVTPAFLPTTITFDTSDTVMDINAFQDHKYDYITIVDSKTKNEYKGWFNTITLPIAKNKNKSVILQAKEL